MLRLLSNLLICFFSLLFLINAPNFYSFEYCFSILIFFVFISIYYMVIENKNRVLGFEIVFMISFLMTNFIYPVFYYPVNPSVSLFQFYFDSEVITKSTAIALVGYSFYMLGNTNYLKVNFKKSIERKFYIDNVSFTFFLCISIILFILYVVIGGLDSFRNIYSGRGDVNNGNSGYVMIIFSIFTTIVSIIVSYINSKKLKIITYSYLIFVILLFFSTGARLFALGLCLILLVQYSFNVKRIPTFVVFIFLMVGASFMRFLQLLREFRGSGSESYSNAMNIVSSDGSVFDVFLDLIINNRNLYVLTSYVDNFGYSYFFNIITSLLSIFPGLSYFISLFDIPIYFQSGMLPTFLEFGPYPAFGLGTNMVGEAYLSLGVLGVVTVFYLFGFSIKFIKNKSDYNIYYNLAFLYLVSQSVFFPRIDYLWGVRAVVWMLLLFFIVNYFVKSLVKK